MPEGGQQLPDDEVERHTIAVADAMRERQCVASVVGDRADRDGDAVRRLCGPSRLLSPRAPVFDEYTDLPRRVHVISRRVARRDANVEQAHERVLEDKPMARLAIDG